MPSTPAGELRRLLPAEAVIDDPLRLSLYGYDGTLFEAMPQVAVLPETTEQVAAVVRVCHAAGVPVVARGGATSLSGGPVPTEGGVVVSFSRMDKVLELDYANGRAVVQPGVVNLDLQNALAPRRFFYAPDPASQSVCTLGGNVGENSGGPHCLKYGVTANHITGLEVVLADGEVLRIGGKAGPGPGYDLAGLLVGSEGTLGLVTEITCRIMPLPEAVGTMLAIFDSLHAASRAVSGIIAAGILPATLEMMDNAMVRAVEAALQCGYPLDAEAVLIVELDGMAAGLPEQIEQVRAICSRHQAREFRVAGGEAERALLWKGRKGAFGAVVNIAPSKICTDISVPRTELPETLAQVMEIGREFGLPIANVFHAGDGNLHPLVLYDPRDEEQARRAVEIEHAITRLAVKMGGVLSGEHGIGCCKRPYMPLMFGPSELQAMWRLKDAFDPGHRLNPGKVLPDPETGEGDAPHGHPARCSGVAERPESPEQVANVLAAAGLEGRPVVIRGAGTKSQALPADARLLSVTGLDRVLDHNHENLTIAVEAGVTPGEIDRVAAERGQMLPLWPRFRDRATIGGVLATAEAGPRRLLYGGPRDLVTGLRVALPNGDLVRFGGCCVKNVAGYAMERLFIGSRGSLGAIVEVTLRTLPRPQALQTLSLCAKSPAELEPFLAELFCGPLRPAAVELLNPAAVRSTGVPAAGPWVLLMALEGFAADVEEMRGRLGRMASEHGLPDWTAPDGDDEALWSAVTDLGSGPSAPMLQVSCALSAVAGMGAQLADLEPAVPLRASPGLGLVHCVLNAPGDAGAYESRAAALATRHRGAVAWLSPTPPGTAAGPQGPAAEVCARIKRAFDPSGILPSMR